MRQHLFVLITDFMALRHAGAKARKPAEHGVSVRQAFLYLKYFILNSGKDILCAVFFFFLLKTSARYVIILVKKHRGKPNENCFF